MIQTVYRVQVFFEYPRIKDIARFTKVTEKIDNAIEPFFYTDGITCDYQAPGPCYGACITLEVENYVQAEMLQEKVVAAIKVAGAVKIKV